MRNCGVTKNVVCRYTVYQTENSNHLDQTIGIIWHERSMLVIVNTGNVIFLKKKKIVTKL